MLELGVPARRIRNSLELCADVGQRSDQAHRISDSNQSAVYVITITSGISVPIDHGCLKALSIEINSSIIFEPARVSAVGTLD